MVDDVGLEPNLAPPIRNGHHTADDQGQHDAPDDRDPVSVVGGGAVGPHLIRVTRRRFDSGHAVGSAAACRAPQPSLDGVLVAAGAVAGGVVAGVGSSFDESSLTSTAINTTTSTATRTATIAPTGERFVVATAASDSSIGAVIVNPARLTDGVRVWPSQYRPSPSPLG